MVMAEPRRVRSSGRVRSRAVRVWSPAALHHRDPKGALNTTNLPAEAHAPSPSATGSLGLHASARCALCAEIRNGWPTACPNFTHCLLIACTSLPP